MLKIGKNTIALAMIMVLLLSFLCLPCLSVEQRLGDVNGDGAINASDATRVLLAAVEKITLSEDEIAAADVNGDGAVNAADAALILLHAVGKKLIPDEPGSTTTTTTTEQSATTTEPTTKPTVPPHNNKENKVTVPEEDISSSRIFFPYMLVIVLTPERASQNIPLTEKDFPDIPFWGIGVENGSNDRWYAFLNCLETDFAWIVDRIQDYDFVQTIEFISILMDDCYMDGFQYCWTRTIQKIHSDTEIFSDVFPDGMALVELTDDQQSNTRDYYLFFGTSDVYEKQIYDYMAEIYPESTISRAMFSNAILYRF